MTSVARAFRVLGTLLAALQLAVSLGAPVHEAVAVARHAGAPMSVTSRDTDQRFAAHDPATCATCQTLRTSVSLPEAPRLLLPAGDVRTTGNRRVDRQAPQRSPDGLFSRAPPQALG
jgi:hypothetical protein